MKICILGDTHFGVRGDSKVFSEFFRKFYTEEFFPYLEEHGITEVFQLGDLFDRRKYINFLTLAESRDYFFDELQKRKIYLHVLIGNHDIFWKENLSVNSPSLLLGNYKNIALYTKPTTIDRDGELIDIIPWICKDNEEEIYRFIEKTKTNICFGHFEIAGFQMYKGIDNHEGISPATFKKYDLVLSGHFHHRSRGGNIVYVGTPTEHTWSDCEDPRGFHIFDTSTRELEFIENPLTIFKKIYYDDTKKIKAAPESVTDKYVKIIVTKKTDPYKFEKFVEEMLQHNPHDLKIVEDMSEFEATEVELEDIDVEDTLTLLHRYVDGVETAVDKSKLQSVMQSLYLQAQTREE